MLLRDEALLRALMLDVLPQETNCLGGSISSFQPGRPDQTPLLHVQSNGV